MESRPLLLGIFSQMVGSTVTRTSEGFTKVMKNKTPQFISVCTEGFDLKETMDESLSFLPYPSPQIMASSNGFLLCCADTITNVNYLVCNPVKKEFQIIPEPNNVFPYAAVAFTCNSNDVDMSLSAASFQIFRVRVTREATTFEVNTFSSTTGEWTLSFPVSSIPTTIQALKTPGLIFKDMIIWRNLESVVVHDTTSQLVQVIPFPETSADYVVLNDHLGDSGGSIYYFRASASDFEVWMLEDITQRRVWILKHKVMAADILRDNPQVAPTSNNIFGRQFHPTDSCLVLVSVGYEQLYWFNYSSGILCALPASSGVIYWPSFLYQWPCEL